jgi:hypothetical protein
MHRRKGNYTAKWILKERIKGLKNFEDDVSRSKLSSQNRLSSQKGLSSRARRGTLVFAGSGNTRSKNQGPSLRSG